MFIERDINHYLNSGYGVDEVLAAALHAITENYLTKVAVEAAIGKTILFQGATAKNRALVAAFEQRLGKPIHVSKFCHLTGAWGIALLMAEARIAQSRFRGLGFHRNPIPIASEVCSLCNNRCKITVADVDGGKVAFGFLCGRDYDIKKFVNNNTSGFDLLKERRRIFAPVNRRESGGGITIGLPAALHLADELSLWEDFFARLGIKTVTSEGCRDPVREGKRLAQAEFCAPLAALHGHVHWLLPRCDYVFAPFALERRTGEKGLRRQYCYYTQYAPALVRAVGGQADENRILTPLVHYLYPVLSTKVQLYRMLAAIQPGISFFRVAGAYDDAVALHESTLAKWRGLYGKTADGGEGHPRRPDGPTLHGPLGGDEQGDPEPVRGAGDQDILSRHARCRREGGKGHRTAPEGNPLALCGEDPRDSGKRRRAARDIPGLPYLVQVLAGLLCHRLFQEDHGCLRKALPGSAA